MPFNLPNPRARASKPRVGLDRSLFRRGDWVRLGRSLHLSKRELQIVQSVFDDHKETVIAENLGLSPHTINTYFQRLYQKLHVGGRSQLLVRVFAEYLALSGDSRNGQRE